MSETDGPRIVALSGPLKASAFSLADAEVCLGRAHSNEIVLDDASVSRRHSLVRFAGDHYELLDLDSRNGTFVNDVPVKSRRLEHGDRIRIGGTLFLFLTRDPEPADSPHEVLVEDGVVDTRTAYRWRPEDEILSMARDLGALTRIATAISSARGIDELQRELLRLIFEIVPAERGAILLTDSAGDFASAYGSTRENEEDGGERGGSDEEGGADVRGPAASEPVRVSRTVVEQVLRDGEAILTGDASGGGEFEPSESLLNSRARALICVPLAVLGRAVGALYLDSPDPTVSFSRDHLRLITAVANVAAGALENARRARRLEEENELLREEESVEHGMIGESPRMREVYRFIGKAAPSDSTVLVNGESGTGKELLARALHRNSARATKSFVAVNCAALTETLLESELFGHERGAFTGAVTQKKGKIEIADGGTLFLDEVAETPPSVQAKLLRVLQEREFERVGGTRTIKVDVRLVAATNKDLEEQVRLGKFRSDLYYRLNVVACTMPPLRERREDIQLLASHFVLRHSRRCKRHVDGLSSAARALLLAYHWPGNVRELENAVERAVVLGSTPLIETEDLPESILETTRDSAEPDAADYHSAVNDAKRRIIAEALERAGGNYTEAARRLGVHPNNLHRMIRNLRLPRAGSE